jgi:hypothetical protein
VPLGGQVVVVAVKGPFRQRKPAGEVMQFGEGHIADQVRPQPIAIRP